MAQLQSQPILYIVAAVRSDRSRPPADFAGWSDRGRQEVTQAAAVWTADMDRAATFTSEKEASIEAKLAAPTQVRGASGRSNAVRSDEKAITQLPGPFPQPLGPPDAGR